MTTQRWAFALAVATTGTAVTLSVLSGWQRGGTLPERLVWVAIGVVLVVTAHLLPALARLSNLRLQFVAAGLWLGCMGASVYGHTTFFLFAQVHAGERREASVASPSMPSGRSLTAIMTERAIVATQAAAANTQRCTRDCPSLRVRRASLAARLDALDAEAGDIRRREALDDRVTAQRDALLADPVTSRLAASLGTTASRVDLLSGLMFAAVLEGVACLLWVLTLGSSQLPVPTPVVSKAAPAAVMPATSVTAVTASKVAAEEESHADATVTFERPSHGHGGTTHTRAPRDDPLTRSSDAGSSEDDLARLVEDIAAGHVRPTVADIRRHLGCSQARATTLRRQLAAHHTAA
ncbi:putative twin-arginine translocation pathway signal protein [Burkholderia pseudomallei]|nr:putative twin-arginine translocation pathway signal protein [Burkholderia pseudomallei]CAJ7618269.1 putative twin-arginine translocation pathway signal protein [Burkholderia pseudomallei]